MAFAEIKHAACVHRILPSPAGLSGWLLNTSRWWHQRELRRRHLDAGRELTVVETLSLGPCKELTLVSCAGERFLVGIGAHGVQTLVRLSTDGGFSSQAQKSTEERRFG